MPSCQIYILVVTTCIVCTRQNRIITYCLLVICKCFWDIVSSVRIRLQKTQRILVLKSFPLLHTKQVVFGRTLPQLINNSLLSTLVSFSVTNQVLEFKLHALPKLTYRTISKDEDRSPNNLDTECTNIKIKNKCQDFTISDPHRPYLSFKCHRFNNVLKVINS